MFLEFVIFICFVANQTYSKMLENGFLLPFSERLKRFLKNWLVKFGEVWVDAEIGEEPEKVTGLDKIDHILLNGEIIDFVAPTPFS